MNQKKYMIIVPVLLFVALVVGYIRIHNINLDSLKFKNEYESLNNTNYSVKINSNNPIKYSSYDEVFDVLKNKTGIIFLGYKEDDNSRYSIETLLNVIEDKNINTTVYYLDMHLDRDQYTIENDKLVYEKNDENKEIKGTDNYFKLVNLLNDYLTDYVIYFNDQKYEVGEKRIYFPLIIFIKEGHILELEYTSLDIDKNELYTIYEDDIKELYTEACDINEKVPC